MIDMCLEILKMKLSENFMSVLLKKYSCLEYLRMVKTGFTLQNENYEKLKIKIVKSQTFIIYST